MSCKDCTYFKDNGVCTLKHIRANLWVGRFCQTIKKLRV